MSRSHLTSRSDEDPLARDEARQEVSDWRLAPAAALCWIVAATAFTVEHSAGWLTGGCAVLATIVLITSRFGPHRLRQRAGVLRFAAFTLLLAALAGFASAHALEQRQPQALRDAIAENAPCRVAFTLTEMVPDVAETGQQGTTSQLSTRFRAQLTSLECGGGQQTGMSLAVLVNGALADGSTREPGTLFRGEARLRDVPPATRSAAKLSLTSPAEQLAPSQGALAVGAELRARFLALAAELPGDGGELVPGLSVGDDRNVPGDLVAAMKTSSLVHLTAVSGANCALVTGAVLLIGRLLTRPRLERLAAASVALIAFTVLVTPQGSVVRASTMAIVVLAADASRRRMTGSSALSLAVLGLVLSTPSISLDAGFALSVAATAGLLLGAGPLSDRLSGWMPRPIAIAIAVPTAAQLLCQPVLVLLDPRVAVYGVLANLLAAPAAPLATLAGLIACLLAPVLPSLAIIASWIAWLPASWIGAVARAVSTWPGASIPVPEGAAGVLLTALPAILLIWWCRERGVSPRTVRRRAMLALTMVLIAAILLGIGAGRLATSKLTRPDNWRYWACDVGQGDALLIHSTEGVVMIDTGPEPERVERCLEDAGIDHLEALILTHFDRDHDGAASSILERSETLILPATREAEGEPLVRAAHSAGVPVSFAGADDSMMFGDLTLHALWPPRDAKGAASDLEGNDSSLALAVRPGPSCLASCVSLVALGDLGEQVQDELLRSTPHTLLGADVVKVSHHGSRDQSAELYGVIQARAALISVGADNSYGHPTSSALEMLQAHKSVPLRTDERGHLVVSGSAEALDVWSPAR